MLYVLNHLILIFRSPSCYTTLLNKFTFELVCSRSRLRLCLYVMCTSTLSYAFFLYFILSQFCMEGEGF
jgi:hypothetical protein